MSVTTTFSLPENEIEIIQSELTTAESIFRTYTIEVIDKNNNKICTAKVQWQIKPWNKTKTIL